MGRMLGSFGDDQELDRPDLNKCPDCGCFFAQSNCPLCGKICPEEFRAGNRKPVKVRRRRTSDSGRVTFIEWYYSWWFIILMLFVFPLLGIILLFTSPHKKRVKAIVIAVAIVYTIGSTYGIGTILHRVAGLWDKPVNTSLSREAYVERCETVTPEQLYRAPDEYKKQFLTTTLTVEGRIIDAQGYYKNDDHTTYYLCRDPDGTYAVAVRDCIRDGTRNFAVGDVIVIWGEGAGQCHITDMNGTLYVMPCVNAAFVEWLPNT